MINRHTVLNSQSGNTVLNQRIIQLLVKLSIVNRHTVKRNYCKEFNKKISNFKTFLQCEESYNDVRLLELQTIVAFKIKLRSAIINLKVTEVLTL